MSQEHALEHEEWVEGEDDGVRMREVRLIPARRGGRREGGRGEKVAWGSDFAPDPHTHNGSVPEFFDVAVDRSHGPHSAQTSS